MSNEPKYERPNTVSGLVMKHKELSDLRDRYKAEIKKLTVDIDHLDAAIRLFDPNADYERKRIRSHVVKHRAQKGTVKKFVLDVMREATEPVTSKDITEAWMADRGLEADEQTYAILRKRLGATIKGCAEQGLIEGVGTRKDEAGGWPYKLWAIVEGGL